MKKIKVLSFIAAAIIIISSIIFIKYQMNNNTKVVNNNTEVEKADLAFGILGDIHGNSGKFNTALNDLEKINGKMDALILNGDSVDQGLVSQYTEIKAVMGKKKEQLPETIIANIGNHDYYNYEGDSYSPGAIENFKNLYYDFSGEKSVYHDKWVKGYHFISLGSESLNPSGNGILNADLSAAQLSWLKYKLAENHLPGRPIFVFIHQHLNTSIKGWTGIVQKKELINILSSYPEVVLFSSHTHVLLSVDNVSTNYPFTYVNTGAVSYAIQPEGYQIKRLYDESQGLYVEVNGKKVTIKGRDFAKKEWIFSKVIMK
ncbi:MAG: metallophosphoesterase family protein [Solirubrobacterales bacterium]